ncbi:GNAT family N-acetyltransferase [Pseudobacteriovorax antillogorgiicola]|uniref:Acetyltransferase (GNAT) domain-containing protein n=1 Tax=Pseudobacteriovorax antillogorgiicola TaxID=1513793 RepID=A0A1Y6BT64_9BACT|nr:GNAT family N-acetyltransferase [Pseudobacteriovorax antillogorgiicola]TCS53103.1 acetyltransferase (GNAT) family protein [Pseudobacteriovorax antillogorgiicola]SMF25753.1 Acetyltransferase (GNAT) domain-containing protein [Pseudobacteriovorax antillogorgiicola]
MLKIQYSGEVKAIDLNKLFTKCNWEASQRSLARTEQYLRTAAKLVGAFYDGELVGFGRLGFDGYVATLSDIIVNPSFRRRKVASNMMTELIDQARQLDAIAVSLLDQSSIEGFYEQFGFKVVNPCPGLMFKSIM